MTPEQIPPEEIDRIYKNENDTSFWKKVSLIFIWCPRGDSNPHGVTHSPLKRARLPFRHSGTGLNIRLGP